LVLTILSVIFFTTVISTLATLIIFAKLKFVPAGNIKIFINGDEETPLEAPVGGKLLNALVSKEIYVPSACGGGATCGTCKVKVLEGGGHILPTEKALIHRKEEHEGFRLSCQVPVKEDLKIEVPPEIFSAQQLVCTVESNRNVATFIKELVLKLPEGEDLNFRAGGYVQILAPSYKLFFKTFNIDEKFHEDWTKMGLWNLHVENYETVTRGYSMANFPEERGKIMLNVRIELPPRGTKKVLPGICSSYIFNLKERDTVTVSGPFGEFFARDTNAEMIFVGGGAGMAPMRSHIFDQLKRLKSKRKISYWYGARSLRELFYVEDFNMLQEKYDNFNWYMALSEPLPEDNWEGYTGFIHKVLYDHYLKDHPAPEDCEYYLCGPPLMLTAVLNLLDNLGVESENIMYDDFGGA